MKYEIQKKDLTIEDSKWVTIEIVQNKLDLYNTWDDFIEKLRKEFRHVATAGFYAINEINEVKAQYQVIKSSNKELYNSYDTEERDNLNLKK